MSMTGFGKKEAQYEDKHISIEVRSLNSKNADVNLRSPSYLRELDPDIRKQLISKTVSYTHLTLPTILLV